MTDAGSTGGPPPGDPHDDADDATARDALLTEVYERIRRLASVQMRGQADDHTLQATALANEAVMRMLQAPDGQWRDRRHAIRAASRIMRQVLVDHARARGRVKRGGGVRPLPLDRVVHACKARSAELDDVDEAMRRLADLDESAALLVELRFFLGLTVDEAAAVLDRSRRSVERDWSAATAWLRKELRRDDSRYS